jgi:hypothetical protein
LIDKSGSQNVAIADEFAIQIMLLVQSEKLISRSYVQHEIDVPLKDLGESHSEIVRESNGLAG